MARFDVFRIDGDHVVDCQADAWSGLSTRLVVPLMPVDDAPRVDRKLNPIFVIEGPPLVLRPNLRTTVLRRDLRDPIASLSEDDLAILGAIDRLLVGY